MDRKWAVHYYEITRLPWHTPVKRARNCAYFAQGYPGPYSIWVTNNTHAYLHYSLTLFIIGGLIYIFNLNHDAFYAVVWWVGLMAIIYTSATMSVLFEPHNLVHTPFSPLVSRIYLGISYVVFQVCNCMPPLHGFRDNTRRRYYDLNKRYSEGILEGKLRVADEIISKPSSEIDDLILNRILLTLNEDHALEMFFDAIPGFCNSKLSVMPLPSLVRTKLRPALDGFLDRTFSSSLVSESVQARRLITCMNAAHAALETGVVSRTLGDIIKGRWVEALKSVEIGHALILWGHGRVFDPIVRRIVACIIARAQRRDHRWTMLVKEAFGVQDGVLLHGLAHGDSALLSILIYVSRQGNRAGSWTSGILSSLSKFDICDTLPGLQNDFCTLWNEIAQEAMNQGSSSIPAKILREIRHLYISLHQGINTAPTELFASTPSHESILDQPSSYLLCNIASHRPDLTACVPVPSLTQPYQSPATLPPRPSPIESDHTSDGCATSQQAKGANVIVELPSPKDYTRHMSHTHEFTSPSLATDSVHVTLATAIADPSPPESIGASHDPRQSAPLAAGISATKSVPSDDPTLQIHPSESGETSQALVSPLIFQHPDLVLATIMSSTRPDPVGDPDALQDSTSSASLSHTLQGNMQQDTVTPCTAPDIGEIPSTVDPIPRSTPTASPTIGVSDSPSLPNLLPARSSGMTTTDPPSFVEPAPIQPDHISHAFRSPSSFLTTASSHDIHDPNPRIPMTVLYSDQMGPPAKDIVATSLQAEDQAKHDLDKL